MKFKMLLWYMARRMELLSRTHPEFIAKLHGRDFVIQVATDEGAHRFFRIQHNRVTSRNTLHNKPDVHLQFASDDIAFRLLTTANATHFMEAMQKQEVSVTGDLALLMWFMSIGKYLRPGRRRAHPPSDSGSAPTSL
ncbi:MAG TPA: SCP2 sterol-binding domain-containing protein [Moraxellaceae bacterium]|nr:SCP2 sterol-binding domain-containing protein [Moraxellaceae bacterium]